MYLVLITLLTIATIVIIALLLNIRKKDRQLIEVLNEKSMSSQSQEERIKNLLHHIDLLNDKYVEDTDYLRERLSWTEDDLAEARKALQQARKQAEAEKNEILASNMAADIARQFVADSLAELREYELTQKGVRASLIYFSANPASLVAHE